jgi:hypothetical protein
MTRPSHPTRLDYSNYTWRRVQITKLLVVVVVVVAAVTVVVVVTVAAAAAVVVVVVVVVVAAATVVVITAAAVVVVVAVVVVYLPKLGHIVEVQSGAPHNNTVLFIPPKLFLQKLLQLGCPILYRLHFDGPLISDNE